MSQPALPPLRERVRLTPVVELPPWDLSQRPSPPSSDQATRRAYWRACLADAGVPELRPVVPGSWCVALTQLFADPALEVAWRVHSQTWDDPDEPLTPEEQLAAAMSFPGGFVLVAEGASPLLPGCCACLATVWDWRRAAQERPSGWDMLWIGHPWVQVRFAADEVLIGPTTESAAPPSEVAVRLSGAAFDAAVRDAEQALLAFADRLVRPAAAWLSARDLPATDDDAWALARVAAGLEPDRC